MKVLDGNAHTVNSGISCKETTFPFNIPIGTLSFASMNSTVTYSKQAIYTICTFKTTNSVLIQETIASSITSSHIALRTVIQGAGAGTILNISLPGNIISLYIYNNVEIPAVIETSTVNSGVTKKFLTKRNTSTIMQRDFINYFPNLKIFI